MTRCGAVKVVNGRPPLVCKLPKNHSGPHGIAFGGCPPYVRWAVE